MNLRRGTGQWARGLESLCPNGDPSLKKGGTAKSRPGVHNLDCTARGLNFFFKVIMQKLEVLPQNSAFALSKSSIFFDK